jgi:hypothetical protein
MSMAEIAEAAKEGLLALAVSIGLQAMTVMFGEDTERLCGPEGQHNHRSPRLRREGQLVHKPTAEGIDLRVVVPGRLMLQFTSTGLDRVLTVYPSDRRAGRS